MTILVKNQTLEKKLEISCEFFPPQTAAGLANLQATWAQLKALNPAFYSVTFGAGGSTQERTFDTIREMRAAGMQAAPHISCIGTSRAQISQMLDRYRDMGIQRLVALRGDMPSGMLANGEFHHAAELVAFIRSHADKQFHIDVAAYPEWHPEAKNPDADLNHFQRKVEAGADAAITQFFFNADAYEHFVSNCGRRGLHLPIVPGIMPIGSFSKLARFADNCGADIPRWMRRKLEAYGDDSASIRAFGLDMITGLCERLIDLGAPGLHFYTLNHANLTVEIMQRLRA